MDALLLAVVALGLAPAEVDYGDLEERCGSEAAWNKDEKGITLLSLCLYDTETLGYAEQLMMFDFVARIGHGRLLELVSIQFQLAKTKDKMCLPESC